MGQPIITDTKQAKAFYLNNIHGCARLRIMIVGSVSEEDTKRKYRKNGFYDESNHFQTASAEQNFKRYATPVNMLRWKQECFYEWSGKEYYFSKGNMDLVSVIELGSAELRDIQQGNTLIL